MAGAGRGQIAWLLELLLSSDFSLRAVRGLDLPGTSFLLQLRAGCTRQGDVLLFSLRFSFSLSWSFTGRGLST